MDVATWALVKGADKRQPLSALRKKFPQYSRERAGEVPLHPGARLDARLPAR